MKAKLVKFPNDVSAAVLMENLSAYAREGNMKWAVVVFSEADGTLRFEWSRLPNNLTAIGAVECLKHELMQQ